MSISLSDFETGARYDGDYSDTLAALEDRLERLQAAHIIHGQRSIIMFEGWDAAGKGGIIQRLTASLDPRYFEVWPIAAPNEEEKARHFLWRFWKRLPGNREISIFDRSWYGRVMVERIEGYCGEDDWKRAYGEINEFEKELADYGTIVLKFWIHIDPETQLERFELRQNTPEKQWKITDEDWRNREKRPLYEAAIEEMLERTDTQAAPWHLIEGDSKRYARVKVIETVIAEIERGCAERGFALPAASEKD